MTLEEIKKELIGKVLEVRNNPFEGSKWYDVGTITNVRLGRPIVIYTNRPYSIFDTWKETLESRLDLELLAVEGKSSRTHINTITKIVDITQYRIKNGNK